MTILHIAPPHNYNVFDMQRTIKAADLKPAARLLLFVLSTYCNAEGRCWPGVPQLANDTGHSRSTIFRALKQLEAAGYITKLPRLAKGNYTSNRYILHVVPCVETDHIPPPPRAVSPCDGGGVTMTPKLSIEQSIQTEEEDSSLCSPETYTGVQVRARVLELPLRDSRPSASSAAVQSFSGPRDDHPPPSATQPPVSVVVEVEGLAGKTAPMDSTSPVVAPSTGAGASVISETAAEDTGGGSISAATPRPRLPSWLQGAPRLAESERATKEEVEQMVLRAQWDNTPSNLALLWCYVPGEVLDWAVTDAEDEATIYEVGDRRRVGVLRRKFRFKLADWACGDDGPCHERRDNLDEARLVSRSSALPSYSGVNYGALVQAPQNRNGEGGGS